MLLFRIKTFSDDNILPETGLGYDPLQCWKLSFLSLAWGLLIGFSGLYFSYIPLYVSLTIISLAILSSMIPIFPDYLNNLLSYDIRSEKGLWFLRKLTVVAISIQGVAFVFFSLFAV